MITAILLLAAAQTPVCVNLQKEFQSNEVGWAILSDVYAGFNDAALGTIKALGPNASRADHKRWEESRQQSNELDSERAEKASQITTLLIANKCTPPDHLASWYTYSSRNPANKP